MPCLLSQSAVQLEVRDGLQAVADVALGSDSERLDLLVVDAGSSDASLPMSCPLPGFVMHPEHLITVQLEVRDGLQAVADVAAGPDSERLDLLVVDA